MGAKRRRRISRVLVAFWVVTAASLSLGCGDDDDDDDGGGGSCLAVCEEQNDLCGSDDDCQSDCQQLEDIASQTGCTNEFNSVLSCIAGLDACDENGDVCSTAAFEDCADQFCVDNPDDPLY